MLNGDSVHRPSVVHDFMYDSSEYTRKQADLTFRDAMRVTGVPRWRYEAMFIAVRLFGWLYKKNNEPTQTKIGE